MPINVKSGESEKEFVERCIPIEIGYGKSADVASWYLLLYISKQKYDYTTKSKSEKICRFKKRRTYYT